jgi:hypothetical protein
MQSACKSQFQISKNGHWDWAKNGSKYCFSTFVYKFERESASFLETFFTGFF